MRRRAGLAAAVAAGALALAGCGGPRNSLNTASSVCFRSLAVAEDAVHHTGRIVGVRRVSAASFAQRVPGATTVPDEDVCLVAFSGAFTSGAVAGAVGPPAGHYAIVAVTSGRPTLLGTRLADELPLRFRHRT
ncbi:MAG: hypothetical protein ABR511_06925 [Acidimicrobiales bacterium]